MIQLSVSEISAVVGGRVVGDASVQITGGVETDSRRITTGSLFVAKPGEVTDGHLFVPAAQTAGAVAVLGQREVATDLPQIIVDDVVLALGKLAKRVVAEVRARGELKVIGITGSNGKTSTKNMLNQVLSRFGKTIAPRESFNNEVGAPISMLLADYDTKFLVVELGADGPGSIAYLADMCRPDIAVELKVGLAHVGEFGGIETTAAIKAELIEYIAVGGTLVYNRDDAYCIAMAAGFAGHKVSFGTNSADYTFSDAQLTLDGTTAVVRYPDQSNSRLRLRILGEHQLYNATASLAVADVLGLDRAVTLSALAELPLAERWRMQRVDRDGISFINDAYNASPDSMKAALQALAVLGKATGRRTVAVIGEMAELGKFSAAEHDSIGRLVVRLNLNQLVVVGEGAKLVHMGASQEGSWDGESKYFEQIDEALTALRGMLMSGDIVLIKSSKSANLRLLGDDLMGVE